MRIGERIADLAAVAENFYGNRQEMDGSDGEIYEEDSGCRDVGRCGFFRGGLAFEKTGL